MEGNLLEHAYQIWGDAAERLREIDESDEWEIFKRKDNFVAMRQPTETLFVLKGECIVNRPAENAIRFIRVPTNKTKFDEDITLAEELEVLDENLKVIRNVIKTPPVISNREAVFVQGLKELDGTTYIASRSIEHPSRPVQDGIVRVNVILVGYVVKPIQADKCTVGYIMNVDPCGSLPKAIVNQVQKSQVQNVLRIKKHVEKER